MKGKILRVLLAVLSCVCLGVGVAACFGGENNTANLESSESKESNVESSASVDNSTDAESNNNTSISESSEESDSFVYSEGLRYECSKDKTYYIVMGLGLCLDRDVVIPDSYNGLPVKEIAGDAFDGEETINSIVIPNTVTTIGIYAFWECTNMTSVTIGDGVTTIGYRAFFNCTSLTSVVIGDGVIEVNSDVFAGCTKLMSIVIGDGIVAINSNAFSDCSNLQKVVIGSSVKTIGESAFVGLGSNQIVCYKGTAEDWKKVEIERNNPYLMWSTIYYYIENEADVPTDGGKYWHYDENGEIAIW